MKVVDFEEFWGKKQQQQQQTWILKDSKPLVESLSSESLSVISFIKTFDFSTLYITIPHPKLKSRLKDLVTIISDQVWQETILIYCGSWIKYLFR